MAFSEKVGWLYGRGGDQLFALSMSPARGLHGGHDELWVDACGAGVLRGLGPLRWGASGRAHGHLDRCYAAQRGSQGHSARALNDATFSALRRPAMALGHLFSVSARRAFGLTVS